MRRLGSFLLGTGVGGAGVHWNAQIWRFLESDFKAYSHNLQRYGKAAVSAYDMTVQDYPLSWSEIEPHYDAFDKLCGTSGKAGNLNGKIQDGGNPFEGPRSAEYPNPPLAMPYGPTLFAKAAREKGYKAFPASHRQHLAALHQSAGRAARAVHLLRLLREVRLRQLFQGDRADHDPAVPADEAELHAAHRVRGAEGGDHGRRQARHRRHLRQQRRRGVLPAGRDRDAVGLRAAERAPACCCRRSASPTTRRPATGVVGKNYAYQTMGSVNVFFEDKIMNPFIGAGALATVVDEFNGDNFDHSGPGLHRRRLHRPDAHRRPPDRDDLHPAGHAQVGR